MQYLLAHDLGTSGDKASLFTVDGTLVKSVVASYPCSYGSGNCVEQNPEAWYAAVCRTTQSLASLVDPARIAGVSFSGHMMGAVLLDGSGALLRPAIIWADQRAVSEQALLSQRVGDRRLYEITGNRNNPTNSICKIMWSMAHDGLDGRLAKALNCKDYLVYRLTGYLGTDYSDASGMLLLDVQYKRWSQEMLEICGVSESQMPKLFESFEVVGTLTKEAAQTLGLPESVKVVAGAGDNAAAAVGTGTVGAGGCNLSLGTSGTIFISSDKFGVDPNNALHAFAHADGGYHLMGCMLSAASCNKWLCEEILKTSDFAGEQTDITDEKLGENHVYFLPYLMGERSPHNDPNARGTFIGMTMDTRREDLTQAVLEGVAFAIRDSFEVAKKLGISISRSKICGGGAKSPLWKKILANVLQVELDSVASEQGPGLGGAMLAMVACGAFANVTEACQRLVRVSETVRPDPELAARYEARYQQFRNIYPACKALFPSLLDT